ncbi:MAG TPA: alpha/beta fold hydrolase [Candidatus Limnocylindrales bacterium]|nr:alpha/beta fold hydrolase [Candidatus Limnocylindrales bacterium]
MTETLGRRPALVLLPGGPGLENYLKPLADLLAPHTEVLLPDPPSVGARQPDPATIVAMTTELDRLRADSGLARWLVAGHSFGADLALAYAMEHPDRTAGLLSICGTGVQDDRQWHAAYEAGRAEGRDPDHLDGIGFDADRHQLDLAAWRAYIKQPGLLARIGRLTTPLWAIYGSEDVRPRWPMDQIVALVPQGRMEVIHGAGHWPWLTHPGETVAIIDEFLSHASSFVAAERRHVEMAGAIDYAGIDHVQLAMPAGQEDEARRFYADVLGLREVAKPPGLAGRGGCWFASDDRRVNVHLGVEPEFRAARKAHPALAVGNLDALRQRLADAGSKVIDDDAIDVRRFYTADPFGNRVEVVEARGGQAKEG